MAATDHSEYESWADFYDATDTDHTSCIAFYRSLVSPSMHSMLDLGCGTGSNTCAIAAAFHGRVHVVALDTSAGMLRHGMARDPSIHWIQADLRNPPVPGPFDFVICCFNVLQLIPREQLHGVFANVRRLLADGGIFAFDLYQPNLAFLSDPPKDRVSKRVDMPGGETLETRESASYDPGERRLHLTWRLHDSREPSAPPKAILDLDVFQHSAADIDDALAAAGLRVRTVYGEFDKSRFTERSRKQIRVCEAAP
jgi:SAM-dependent methyltransferase